MCHVLVQFNLFESSTNETFTINNENTYFQEDVKIWNFHTIKVKQNTVSQIKLECSDKPYLNTLYGSQDSFLKLMSWN